MSSVPQSALHWFEIPVTDIDRAQRFYETLLAAPLRREAMGPQTLAVLPYAEPGVGGALLAGLAAQPGAQGVVVYLDGGARLEEGLARLAQAGGQILTPRVDLPDGMGSFVHFQDSEGNRVGLHAAG
ncbi:VOC family protein [Ideonella dechloratans]|uniref:VOC family protein n=1 Tax=Ideonella dechloratans TaxID=36863 RepID=A0A643FAH8_IDEDE|nr:VOC family protein [Ideonella dechloratans]KAB0580807.1 VOC family protein [Ideonella dechloratans]UFU10397.1 VOC family protein [Ideonella dechloratans]